VAAVSEDFWDRLNTSIVAVEFARLGIMSMHQRVSEIVISDPVNNPDPTIHLGAGDPNDPATQAHAGMTISRVLELTRKGGEAELLLGRQWLVSIYQDWDEDVRPRLAQAHGVTLREVVVPALGDLRLIRHDIIHHHGLARDGHGGKCQVLKWFESDEEIDIRSEHFLDLRNTQIPTATAKSLTWRRDDHGQGRFVRVPATRQWVRALLATGHGARRRAAGRASTSSRGGRQGRTRACAPPASAGAGWWPRERGGAA